jgi:hypothetical protein
MIYKIFPSCSSSCFFSLQAICSSQRLNRKQQKTKQKLPKQKTSEVMLSRLQQFSNQFALPKLESFKSLKGFICWRIS